MTRLFCNFTDFTIISASGEPHLLLFVSVTFPHGFLVCSSVPSKPFNFSNTSILNTNASSPHWASAESGFTSGNTSGPCLHPDLWQVNGGQALTSHCRRPTSSRPLKWKDAMKDGGRRAAVMLTCWHGGIVSGTAAAVVNPPVWYGEEQLVISHHGFITANWWLKARKGILFIWTDACCTLPSEGVTAVIVYPSNPSAVVPVMLAANLKQVRLLWISARNHLVGFLESQ